ncbi:hypothetical protein ES288_D05G137900v1 [Gossypium darwinii]|uniref:Myb/SANT-like DNA-binding domain-containing protein n=1 Tax=Gossypium darwinii TaxID=34276 RepID=A0A5D2CF92_GOSDA|nr:hypothetical protein ES288_D05G137900v1 [Gossypium darwinii]
MVLMDDIEDDARYPPNQYGVSHQRCYGSLSRRKLPVRNFPYSRSMGNQDVNVDDEVEDEEDFRGEAKNFEQNNVVWYIGKNMDNEDDDELDDGEDDDDDGSDKPKGYNENSNDVDLERHPKKRKLKNLLLTVAASSMPKPSHCGRNSLTDWTEHETFVLLDAWGGRFLQRGRNGLRSEEWQEVAEKVSKVSMIERTDTQCCNRLDTLKKKYKKEKAMLAETSATTSKWVYFKKVDMLMAYSNCANGMDKMRYSPADSESADSDEDISDGLPPKKRRFGRQYDEGSSFRMLADSIHKFSNIYEKIENSKRHQMLELEKMRMEIHMELEMQKRRIMENAQAEIVKIQQGDEEDNDVSIENASG